MSGAYYNEIDPFAAAWLRELIKADLIAPGEVDERSIEEVEPEDLRGFTQCHFFAGIGVWSYALRNAGWSDASPVWSGSCPCQGFSASGQRGGFSDKRHLWPAWFRLISECRPVAVFGEQVASKDGLAWLDVVSADMEREGYAIGATDICAAGVGAPHIRQRMYFVGALDYAAGSRRQAERQHGSGSPLLAARLIESGADGSVADARNTQRRARSVGRNYDHAEETERNQSTSSAGKCSTTCDMAHAPDAGFQERNGIENQQPRTEQRSERLCIASELVNTNGKGPQRYGRLVQQYGTQGRQVERRHDPAPSFVGGFWRDAEWIYCRDEKYRPVEPGTFPLVNGTPNRVGRLRGYGNAINAEVAKAFIEAYMSI